MTYTIEPRDDRFWVVSIDADGTRKEIASYQTAAQGHEGVDTLRRDDVTAEMARDFDERDTKDKGFFG